MSRTLAGGRRAGIGSGLGSAGAYAIAVAVVGRASAVVTGASAPLRLFGGLILVGLGIRLGLTRSPGPRGSTSSACGLTLVLGLANPVTLVYFAAVVTTGAVPVAGGPSVVAGVRKDATAPCSTQPRPKS